MWGAIVCCPQHAIDGNVATGTKRTEPEEIRNRNWFEHDDH
jgi:hypothetical protein